MNFEILYCWLMLFGLCLVGSVGNGIWTDLLDDYRVCHLFCVRVCVFICSTCDITVYVGLTPLMLMHAEHRVSALLRQ
jgi:hypothetical protein